MLIDDIVAEGSYNIQQLYNYPNNRSDNCRYFCDSEYVDVFYQGQPAGRILLSLQLQQGVGFNQGGFNQGGFNQGGYNQGGNQGGFGGDYTGGWWFLHKQSKIMN